MEQDSPEHAPDHHHSTINFTDEPHLGQAQYLNKGAVQVRELAELERVLADQAPRREYFKIPHDKRTVNHWGQRKLLLSEIEFLTLHGEPGCIVVYAGAAPGTHIPYLAKLFPEVKTFVLYDPADFRVEASDRIEVCQDFFTDEVALQLKERFQKDGSSVLFISDIRTADPKVMNAEEVEEAVANDMELQMDWVKALRPKASMLKFRLPWGEGISTYFKGDIYLPVWGPQTTTESRLIVTDRELTEYDNTKYGDQMFYFNSVTRVSYYKHGVKVPGLDHCYDCAAEVVVLKRYWDKRKVIATSESDQANELKAFNCSQSRAEPLVVDPAKEPTKASESACGRSCLSDSEVDLIKRMCLEITQEISPHGRRTLENRLDVVTRKSWFRGRLYDVEGRRMFDLGPVDPTKDINILATPRQPRAIGPKKRRHDEVDNDECAQGEASLHGRCQKPSKRKPDFHATQDQQCTTSLQPPSHDA